MKPNPSSVLCEQLQYLQLPFIKAQCADMAAEAARNNWDHQEYLRRLVEGEYLQRQQRSIQRRLKAARFPVIKTLDQFLWDWPKKINRLQIQNLFRLEFVAQKGNVIFLGSTGLGKTHLAISLGYAACMEGHSVLFTDAIAVVNDLTAALQTGSLKAAIKQYLRPRVLVIDEVGYLAIDQRGADLLFQVISQRYERGSIILTTNKPFNQWGSIFANDSTIASAVLDRLLHHAEAVLVTGRSYRMKDKGEASES